VPPRTDAIRGAARYHSLTQTLTFLFTDLEGSTALVQRLGDGRYAGVLADHHRVIRAVLERFDGHEEGTQGDAFFATFTSARAGVDCAVEIQRRLARHPWPDGVQVRVRIGVHTGEASQTETGLVGYEVHRAARIAAVGHGGQILLSAAAAGLVETSVDARIALRDLGPHRLKDLGRPETIFQVVAEDLDETFAPLRSLDNPELANNLPVSLSPFIGRRGEVEDIAAIVRRSRLTTLTGSGGAGKTRLALQVAAELLDGTDEGVWLVELAPLTSPDDVVSAILNVFNVQLEFGEAPHDGLVRSLRGQHVLLVLDNCEHLIDEVAKVAELVARHCPRVSLLATSREPLGIGGEEVVRVRSMSLPDGEVASVDDVAGFDAIDLFVARARGHDQDFALSDAGAVLVTSICRRLDGIPLAIELAAARTATMALADLNDRLDQRFRLLTGGSRNALPRQQTLAATIAWSYDLLAEVERSVLRRLTVFVDGFELAAAEEVCAGAGLERFDIDEVVGSLVTKSLVGAERSGERVRYRLLETIRQFCADALVSLGLDEVDDVRSRHAEHYLALALEGGERICRGETARWTRRFDLEWGNLRAATQHLLDVPERSGDALELLAGARMYLMSIARLDVHDLLLDALARTADQRSPARVRVAFIENSIRLSRPSSSEELEEAASELREIVDTARVVGDAETELRAIVGLTNVMRARGESLDPDEVVRIERLGEESDDPLVQGGVHLFLSLLDLDAEDSPEAWVAGDPARERALECFRRAGSLLDVCTVLIHMGLTRIVDGSPLEESLAICLEALALANEIGATGHVSMLSTNIAVIYALAGQPDRVDEYVRPVVRWMKSHDYLTELLGTSALASMAAAVYRGEFARGATLKGSVDALLDQGPHLEYVWTPRERAMYDALTASLREELGDDLDDLVRRGASLTTGEMLDLVAGRAAGPAS
jgi:predicted ATPase/class 3 adenylate cyclase